MKTEQYQNSKIEKESREVSKEKRPYKCQKFLKYYGP